MTSVDSEPTGAVSAVNDFRGREALPTELELAPAPASEPMPFRGERALPRLWEVSRCRDNRFQGERFSLCSFGAADSSTWSMSDWSLKEECECIDDGGDVTGFKLWDVGAGASVS